MQQIFFLLSVCLQWFIVMHDFTKNTSKINGMGVFPRENESCKKLLVVQQNYRHTSKNGHIPGVEAKGSIILMVGVYPP